MTTSRTIYYNRLTRMLKKLEEIRDGRASFCDFFNVELEEWPEVVDLFIAKIRREIAKGAYNELKTRREYPPFLDEPALPDFESWLIEIRQRRSDSK